MLKKGYYQIKKPRWFIEVFSGQYPDLDRDNLW